MKSIFGYLFALMLIGMIVGQITFFYPSLPDQVAVNFDIQGQAKGWLTKIKFLQIYLLLVIVLHLMMGLKIIFIHKIPPFLISLPYKDYWLNSNNQKQSYQFLRKYLLWFHNITIISVISMMQFIFSLNIYNTNYLPKDFWIILSIYIIFIVIWTIGFFIRFSKPKLI